MYEHGELLFALMVTGGLTGLFLYYVSYRRIAPDEVQTASESDLVSHGADTENGA
jgi:nitrogen regulatory protein PII-like uncharacterized protein